MAFLSDMFSRVGRVARGQANAGVDVLEDATFEATVKQTVADMRTELNKAVQASAVAMSNYNRLDAEYQKYVRKSQVAELKRKIDEGERTATTLVARKNAATAQRKVAEALAGVGNADNAFAALGSFEEKVAREEATAQAFNRSEERRVGKECRS